MDELNSQMIDLPNVTLLNDTNAIWIKNEAFRIRKSMNKIWRSNLNQRKQAFRNMLKNENTSVIYVDWFRVTVHKQQIRDPHTRMLGVSKHIDECAAGLTPQFTIFPFYKILSPSEGMRKNKERFFLF